MPSNDQPFRLETFHQLLHDQLMPWLPAQSDNHFLKAWHLYDQQHKESYLLRLQQVYRRNGRRLPTALEEEWRMISRVRPQKNITQLLFSLYHKQFASHKLNFYNKLIANAFAYSYAYVEQNLRQSSEARLQFSLQQLLSRHNDLYESSGRLLQLHEGEDAVVIGLVHLYLHLFHRLLNHTYSHKFKGMHALVNREMQYPVADAVHAGSQQLAALHALYLQSTAHLSSPAQASSPKKQAAEGMDVNFEAFRKLHTEGEGTASSTTTLDVPGAALVEETAFGTNEPPQRPPYSTKEAAELLGISPNGLREKAKQGEIPFFKIGKLFKFRHEDIEAFQQHIHSNQHKSYNDDAINQQKQ